MLNSQLFKGKKDEREVGRNRRKGGNNKHTLNFKLLSSGFDPQMTEARCATQSVIPELWLYLSGVVEWEHSLSDLSSVHLYGPHL